MINQGQIEAMRRGVNCALGLPEAHGFGNNFVDQFIVRQARVSHESYRDQERLVTTYDGLCSWCDSYDYKYKRMDRFYSKFRITPSRYQILAGILEVAQALLRVELFYEGGDLPLPPEVKA